MGAAIDAVPKTVGTVVKNPSLVVAAFVAGIGMLIVFGLSSLIPIVGPFLAMIFVTPLFVGGFLAMVNAGMTGKATVEDFTDGMSEHYVSLTGGYVIAMLLGVVATIGLAALIAVTVGIGSLGAGPGTEALPSEVAAAAGLSTIALIFVGSLVIALAFVLVQFFDVAIVVGNESATSSFRESVALCLSAPLSVLGYTVLRAIITLIVAYGPLALVWGASTVALDGVGTMIAVGLAYLIAMPIAYVVSYGYHVAYFRERRPDTGSTPVA